jgi:Caspase domain
MSFMRGFRPAVRLALAVAALGLGILGALRTSSIPVALATPDHAPKKLALLVGITKYRFSSVPQLEGCLNDVRDMEKVLRSDRYGFTDIVVLRNEQATHKGIVDEFEHQLIKKAQAGDIVLFYYSGHGSRMKDPKEIDRYSSTIVPYDSRDSGKTVTDIRNSELNDLLHRVPTDNKTVILDSCFSGTAFKGLGRAKLAPEDTRFGDSPPPLPESAIVTKGVTNDSTSGFRTGGLKYVLLAASGSDQVAFEYPADDEEHGALTYFLVQQLRKPSNQMTYNDVMDRVSSQVESQYPTQNPQIDGSNGFSVLFGDLSIISPPYLRASPAGVGRVKVRGGAATGLTEGSIFDIYSPSSHVFAPPEQPLATMTLESPSAFESFGKIGSQTTIEVGSKAIERQHRYGAVYTRVMYEGLENSHALQSIKAAFESQTSPPQVKVVQTGAYDLRLTQEIVPSGTPEIHIRGASGADIRDPIGVDDSTLIATMVNRIDRLAQWFSTMSLHNDSSSAKISFVLAPDAKNKGSASGTFDPGKSPSFVVGDKFSLTITNSGKKKMFVYLLDMTDNGSIKCFYPEEDDPDIGKALPRGQSKTINDLDLRIDEPKRAKVLDIIKLIATTKQIPIDYLQQDAPRDVAPLDPLGQMIAKARKGRREIGTGNPGDWFTTQISVTTRKPSEE